MSFPAPVAVHDLTVIADGFVLVLTCSCGEFRLECSDNELPLAEVVRAGEDHRYAAAVQAEALTHLGEGHHTRLRPGPGGGMGLVCSCGYSWPVEVLA